MAILARLAEKAILDHMADPTTPLKPRWFRIAPGHLILALLAIEGLLFASERFRWLPWHKGYAVLTVVALVAAALLLMAVWFAVALVFKQRFQFSLRSLLLLTVVVALPCGWMASEMKAAKWQREAVIVVEEFGGLARYDYEPEQGASLDVEPGPAALREILGKEFFADVVSILFMAWRDWDYPDVTDSVLGHIGQLSRLQALEFCGTCYTDAGMKNFESLPELRTLHLANIKVTDDGLQSLRQLKRLEMLDLAGCRITDKGLDHLSRLSNLRVLVLADTCVTPKGLQALQQTLPDCEILHPAVEWPRSKVRP